MPVLLTARGLYFAAAALRRISVTIPIARRSRSGVAMTQSQTNDERPWWESELPVIRHKLNGYLRWRLPGWSADHEDLLGDALLGLTLRIRQHASSLPQSWFGSAPPQDEDDQLYLYRLAMIILRRRIADLFRRRASLPKSLTTIEGTPDVADKNTAIPERQITLTRVLEVTRAVLDEMPAEDRDLIALVSGEDRFRKALDARERQRLSRARKQLRNAIVQHLGADIADLLRIKD
jgi:hypothetical protein